MDLELFEEDIITQEGTRPLVYDDATGETLRPGMTLQGHPTIGSGRALDVNGLSSMEISLLRQNDIQNVNRDCMLFPWFATLDDVRQRVIASMVFNLGIARFEEFVKLIQALMNQNYIAAHDEILNSLAAQQDQARYKLLAQRMLTGVQ